MKPHPIYQDAVKASMKATPVHISLTDTAKLIRTVLKARFPGVKFSVRSERYAGGCSISVRWVDGPSSIDGILSPYNGKGFDGMIDMAYYRGAWFFPDGSAAFRQTSGTTDSMGMVPAESTQEPTTDAVPVSFAANYVFGHRRLSKEQVQKDIDAYVENNVDELSEAILQGKVSVAVSGDHAYAEGASSILVGGVWGDAVLHRARTEEDTVA